jgi:aspartate aminotransferase
VDVRRIVPEDFDAMEFVLYCARRGAVERRGRRFTLLVAPMSGFYSVPPGTGNPGRTQMRIAYVEPPEQMKLVPGLFAELLEAFLRERPGMSVPSRSGTAIRS